MASVELPKCNCRCGDYCNRPYSTYKPGHDARHAGNVGREIAARWEVAENADISDLIAQLTGGLIAKAHRVAAREALRLARKNAGRARKTTKVAPVLGTCRKGRWTYPARVMDGGAIQMNTKRDGSGTWTTPSESVWDTFTTE